MTVSAIAQVIIALGIFNVWILRYGRPTPYRPSNAANMADEFRRYGLPDWARMVVGATKLSLAVLLIVGLQYTPLVVPSAAVMVVLMVGAILAHVRAGDPLVKSVPALTMLALSTIVVATHGG